MAINHEYSKANLEWQNQAACLKVDPELFFPESRRMVTQLENAAKRVCGGCAVRAECLEYALGFDSDLQGVWGGLSGEERRKLKRRTSRVALPGSTWTRSLR